MSLTLQANVYGPMQETVPEFQVADCALFLARGEVVHDMDELNCVKLPFGILKNFHTVSRQVRMETQAYQDSTEERRKGWQLEFGDRGVHAPSLGASPHERYHKEIKIACPVFSLTPERYVSGCEWLQPWPSTSDASLTSEEAGV